MYKLISFDFDGTLADSADWVFDRLNQLAGEFKFKSILREEEHIVRGLDTGEMMKYLAVPAWRIPQILARMRSFAAGDVHRLRLFPGIPEMFRGLRNLNLNMGIVSSNSEAIIRQLIGPEIASWVKHYGCGSSLFGKAAKLKTMLRATKTAAPKAIISGTKQGTP